MRKYLLCMVTVMAMVVFVLQGSLFATEGLVAEEGLEIHFISTGNSDAILIKDDGKTMLIDGAENDDEAFLVQYLKNQGVERIDYVILTHPDADHCGGLDAVINQLDIGTGYIGNGTASSKTYRDFVMAATNKGLQPSVPVESNIFTLGKGTFQFYNTTSQSKLINDRSLVTLFQYGEHKFLFMGDAGVAVERNLPLEEIGVVDVLKVGHHGSNTATSGTFVTAVSPTYSMICVGVGNKYGHPNQSTLQTLKNTTIYRTDLEGYIVLYSDGAQMTITTQRQQEQAKEAEMQAVIEQEISSKEVGVNRNGFTHSFCVEAKMVL